MLYCRIRRRRDRRFRTKILSGQGYPFGKTYHNSFSSSRNNIFNKGNKKFNYLKILLIILIFAFFKLFTLGNSVTVSAKENEAQKTIYESIQKVLETLELDDIESLINDLGILDGKSLATLISDLISGNISNTFADLFKKLKSGISNIVFEFTPYIASILSIILFIAIIDALKPDSFDKSVCSVCVFICNLLIIGIVCGVFLKNYTKIKSVVEILTKQIEVVFPVIMTLMTASGGSASISVFKPSVALLCNVISVIFGKFLMPITVFLLAFCAINSFSNVIKADKAVEFLKSVFKWVIGISSVFFCFFVTTQGIAASVYDNVSLKALKYAVGNSIPLINSLLSSGFDVIVASCVLVKNALGTLSLIAIIYTVAAPILKLVILSLILRLLAAVSQSIANDSTIKFISGAADCVTYLATAVSIVSICYMVTVLITMCSLGGSI